MADESREFNKGGRLDHSAPVLLLLPLVRMGILGKTFQVLVCFAFCLLFLSYGGQPWRRQWLGCLTEIRGEAKPSTVILGSGMRFSGARIVGNLREYLTKNEHLGGIN